MKNTKWDTRFIEIAKVVASWSKDPSTKVGAVIVDGKEMISSGFNGFPANTPDNDNLYRNKDIKYLRVIHAEINAILYAKRDLTGCTLYCTAPPCCQCTAAIIQSGIKKIVYLGASRKFLNKWKSSIVESEYMMDDAGVEYYEF